MAVVVVAGKGGVGKSTVVAGLARILQARGAEFAVVDADPVGQLGALLGLPEPQSLAEVLGTGNLDEEGFALDDVASLLGPLPDGGRLLTMGHAREEGCFCRTNAVTRAVLVRVLAHTPLVLVDSEAGVEHVTRGTGRHATRLVLMADEGRAAFSVAADILATVRQLNREGHRRLRGTVHLGVYARTDGARKTVVETATRCRLPRPAFVPHSGSLAAASLLGAPVPRYHPDDPFYRALGGWVDRDQLLEVGGPQGQG